MDEIINKLKDIAGGEWKPGAVAVAAMAVVGWIFKTYMDSQSSKGTPEA
jgi:hypothetical protein